VLLSETKLTFTGVGGGIYRILVRGKLYLEYNEKTAHSCLVHLDFLMHSCIWAVSSWNSKGHSAN